MPRRTTDIAIDGNGRDAGRVFRITEMLSDDAEEWLARAVLAVSRAGVEVPDELAGRGMAGLAAMDPNVFGKVAWDDMKPLLDGIMSCVSVLDGGDFRPLRRGDIEEIGTRIKLRIETVKLHLVAAAAPAKLTSAVQERFLREPVLGTA